MIVLKVIPESKSYTINSLPLSKIAPKQPIQYLEMAVASCLGEHLKTIPKSYFKGILVGLAETKGSVKESFIEITCDFCDYEEVKKVCTECWVLKQLKMNYIVTPVMVEGE